jgi:hypothetical protein
VTTRDWIEWHLAYDDDTPLLHRLRAVQRRISEALDDCGSVGVHRLTGMPEPLPAGQRLFTFVEPSGG